MQGSFSTFWHQFLKRPYRLAVTIDQGSGSPVVLLHGLGSSGGDWRQVALLLATEPYHVLALDLLGFGQSPKPTWPRYTVDDHAQAVIATLNRLVSRRRPAIVVGHSMGCLVAVRVARLRPDLVKYLILYQMPLYHNLPQSRRYSLRRDFYFKLYNHLLEQPPRLTQTILSDKFKRLTGWQVSPVTWQPFIRSLRHTIMEQTTLQDLRQLQQPLDIIYGSLDMVVIRGKPRDVFAEVPAPFQIHTITQLHTISLRASKFIARRIRIAATDRNESVTP